MIILEGINIRKIYGGDKNTEATTALNDIDIKLHKGDFTTIMGPSGSGKTTLLNILSGLSKPSTGQVEFKGISLNSLNNKKLAQLRRKNMGFVFQDFNLLDSLTLKENIILPMILDRKQLSQIETSANEVIKVVNLEKVHNKYPYNVSGGEQQRTAIARALINNPDIIFADEPTGNLDSKSSETLMKCFQTINQSSGRTILMVTHDVFTASFSKKIIFIKDGRLHSEIIRKGSNKEFFNDILDSLSIIGGLYSEL